ncbi:hypothetical protein HYPSUDRAFT_438819 [Hypholoma sublateritium FD-334 SS-4]|uniref:Uncharacterized protein n=1 Tax=Hypholoma sublateritium (strain FD-334 SS-4) TaxID=945553 RepID=A0A0D2M8T0_HYPSF|nr:hypothetical protein HYPSUDRAFT_853628 [Hypholoma sublateritium FD-334 SS-4]KJA25100.1 hypothetical protein HYPSUDRAFT_438819 [Hypholoma sublateritium FD-334 SS-4]
MTQHNLHRDLEQARFAALEQLTRPHVLMIFVFPSELPAVAITSESVMPVTDGKTNSLGNL